MTQRMGKNSRDAPQRDLGSARASRAGDGALAIANFVVSVVLLAREVGFGEGAETGTRGRVRSPEFALAECATFRSC